MKLDEHLQEQASLYVFDLLDPEEERAFVARMEVVPELRRLVDELMATAATLAQIPTPRAVPPHLEAAVLARVRKERKIIAFPEVPFPLLGWAVAAALVLGCFYLASQWVRTLSELEAAKQAPAHFQAQVTDLEEQLTRTQDEVTALKQRDSLAKVQIANLTSKLAQAPTATAVILWDEENQRGVLEVKGLPRPAPNQDYQLWIIDPQYAKPADAGVFQLDRPEATRVTFSSAKPIRQAQKFAVSLERKGGAPEAQGAIILLGE